ncbi:MAG TPA: PDZ domain-containing protein [Pirellulales bacterium]|jgi:predicted aspartyl protease
MFHLTGHLMWRWRKPLAVLSILCAIGTSAAVLLVVVPAERQRRAALYLDGQDVAVSYDDPTDDDPGWYAWAARLAGDAWFDYFYNVDIVGIRDNDERPPLDLQCLAAFPHLKELHFRNYSATANDSAAVGTLKELRTVASFSPITDQAAADLAGLAMLRDLYLDASLLGDDGIEHLAGLGNLTNLDLSHGILSGRGLEKLKTVANLSLDFTTLADGALGHIGRLSQLRILVLRNSSITSIEGIEGLDQLWELDLNGSRITDEGLKHVGQLKSLTLLNVANTAITDEGVEAISKAALLERLILSATQITDQGMQHLARLRKLEELQLHDTKITDAGTAVLEELPKLKCLGIDDTAVTADARARLPKSDPNDAIASLDWSESPQSAEFPLHEDGVPQALLTLGGRNLRVVIDTGATASLLDIRFRGLLGGRKGDETAASPIATSRESYFDCPGGKIGRLRLDLPEIFCMNLGPDITGEGEDGFLGMDFLKSHCVDFDWDAGAVRILWHVPGDLAEHAELNLAYNHSNMPVVTVRIGDSLDLPTAIDTGSNRGLSLSLADEKRAFPDGFERALESLGMTVHGTSNDAVVRLPKASIGDFESTNILCCVKNAPSAGTTIGCDFLRRYRAIFDFAHDKLLLVPRRQQITDEADMSGLHILQWDEAVIAVIVDDDSPAAEAGIRPGETLTAVDGIATSELRNTEIRQRLRSGDGNVVRLDVGDGQTQRTVGVKLRRRI